VIVCWAAKGGSGTTVVACAVAVIAGRRAATTLVDLAGDVPAALGVPEPSTPGVGDWLRSVSSDPAALADLRIHVGGGLSLLPAGHAPLPTSAVERLAAALADLDGEIVVDAGTGPPPPALVERAHHALLVTRSCYLAVRRAVRLASAPTGVVLVREAGRSLRAVDIERSIGAPVVAQVEVDPAVARAVDAGLLANRLPLAMLRGLRPLDSLGMHR
jgi:MinD superfamily P-loop ATPase